MKIINFKEINKNPKKSLRLSEIQENFEISYFHLFYNNGCGGELALPKTSMTASVVIIKVFYKST